MEAARTAREQWSKPYDYNEYELEDVNPDFGIKGYPSNRWEEADIICYKGEGYGPNEEGDYNLSEDLISLFDKETDLRWKLFITSYPFSRVTILKEIPPEPLSHFPIIADSISENSI